MTEVRNVPGNPASNRTFRLVCCADTHRTALLSTGLTHSPPSTVTLCDHLSEGTLSHMNEPSFGFIQYNLKIKLIIVSKNKLPVCYI